MIRFGFVALLTALAGALLLLATLWSGDWWAPAALVAVVDVVQVAPLPAAGSANSAIANTAASAVGMRMRARVRRDITAPPVTSESARTRVRPR